MSEDEREAEPEAAPSLRLDLHPPCRDADSLAGHYAVMPSLRLEMLSREYHEPVRDRDKDWSMVSQRNILNAPLLPPHRLQLGEHKKTDAVGSLMWSPALQSLVRKVKILSTVAVISHTYCMVDVFGFGISGRIFSEGANNVGRFLIIEAYSVWNSCKYVVMLPALTLKSILASDANLLRTGLKRPAILSLLKRLCFLYTVRLTYPANDEKELKPASTQSCRHLEPPQLPAGLPQSIPDIIHFIQNKENTESLSLGLQQELCVDVTELLTGPQQSRAWYKRRLAADDEAFWAQRKAWLDTPLRRRGLLLSATCRHRGKLVVLSAYKFPRRPLSLTVRCHAPIECGAVPISLSLVSIAREVKVYANPHLWPQDVLLLVVRSTTRGIRLRVTGEADYSCFFGGTFSPAVPLQPLKSAAFNIRRNCSVLSPFRSVDWSVRCYNNSRCVPNLFRDKNMPILKPRREVGRGLRICSKCVSIHGVSVVFSLYLTSPLMSGPLSLGFHAGLVEASDGSPEYDAMNAHFTAMCSSLDVTVEVYTPHLNSFCGVRIEGSSTRIAVLSKEDVFRMTGRDLTLFATLTRVAYLEYYEAQPDDVRSEVRLAWSVALRRIVSSAHWGLAGHRLDASPLLHLAELSHSNLFLTASVADVSSYSQLPVADVASDAYAVEEYASSCLASEVVLRWSAEVFRKPVMIDNEDSSQPQRLLQMVVWEQGSRTGIVSYDREHSLIYFAQDAPPAQRSQIELNRCLSEAERIVSTSLYLSLCVKFYSEESEAGVVRGIRLVESMEGPRFDLGPSDLEARAAAATQKASEDLQRRLNNTRKGRTYT